MSDIVWPSSLAPRRVALLERGMSVVGPASLSARRQVSSYDAGFWRIIYRGVPVNDAAKVKAYRALKSQLSGGSATILIPIYDSVNVPWPTGVSANAVGEFSDGTTYSDGTGFFNPAIDVTLNGDHDLRSTLLTVTKTSVGTISGGEHFSIGARLHRISKVVSATEWQVWPPLREDLLGGRALNFETPKCRVQLVGEDSGDLELERGLYGFVDMEFVEAV